MTDKYSEIILMSKKICMGSVESEEVAHFAIAEFLEHERGQELVDAGKAMSFISGIIWRSFRSSTSQYHTTYRQKGRVHTLHDHYDAQNPDPYNYDLDRVHEAIAGILEDMSADRTDLWFRAELFKMWIETPNYSELYRRTGIPRTSISLAVEECKVYIKQQLKIQDINYEF